MLFDYRTHTGITGIYNYNYGPHIAYFEFLFLCRCLPKMHGDCLILQLIFVV